MLRFLTALFLALCPALCPAATDLVYRLPTENDALFRNDGDAFYMYCDRNFEGEKTQPWQAGSYGMVRNPFRAPNGKIMFSRLHEGIDIKPLRRDTAGEPLDIVRPVAPGVVVHANDKPGASNYGRYVVVAHRLPEGMIFSLYAHLGAVRCSVGQRVGTGNELGVLGHSGVGLNRVRSHLHLELCLMINSAYTRFCPEDNKHGLFNGLNLIGFDAAPVLKACRDGEPLSLRRHFATLQEHYRVRVPRVGKMDLLRRYPFLYKGKTRKAPRALDIAFTAEGVPIAVYPADQEVVEPVVVSCRPMPTLQQNCTANRVKNNSRDAALTVSGKRYVNQYLWLEGLYPRPQETPPQEPSTPATKP